MKNRNIYIDTAALFLCSALLSVNVCPAQGIVQLILKALILSVLMLVLGRKALYAAEIAVPAICVFVPQLSVFAPTAVYSAAVNRHKVPLAAGAAIIIASAFSCSTELAVMSAALTAAAAVLGLRSGELSQRREELMKLRDSDTQLTLELQQKNKSLIEKQDYEVRLATLNERNRIAREIHDNVGHLLSRGLLQTGALLAVTDKEKMPVQYAQASAVKETMTSAMNSIRESVHGLRDDSIDLHHAINEAVGAVQTRFRVICDLDFSEKMPPNIKLCFIACIKEALSNAVKHSSGNEIHITVREHPAIYQMCVFDNGKSKKKTAGSGMGLNNMRERAESLGGIFRIDDSDGFRIFISVKRGAEVNQNADSSR